MLFIWILIGLLSGLLAGNGFPHFVRGITKQNYPSVFGSGPATNLIVGWIGLTLASIGFAWISTSPDSIAALVAGAIGVLAIGLFHATIGAFGRDSQPSAPTESDGRPLARE